MNIVEADDAERDARRTSMSNQSRTVDLIARGGKFVEVMPDYVVSEVMAKMQAILE